MSTFSGEPKYLRRKTPSFSSSLLDSIYRSIDEPSGKEDENRMRRDCGEEVPSLRRAIMVEKWIEDHGKKNSKTSKHSLRNSNGSNSSDSSCCATLFSSSDNESSVTRSLQKSSSLHTMQTPKREKKFISTTKSKALQIYSELKKVKQPISPGGRIARLLNSIFSSKTSKKHNSCNENICSVTKSRSLKDLTTSSYAASSLSTTCSSKTPCKIDSSGMKRAVRFSPVIKNFVGEDCKKKNVDKDDPRIVSFPVTRNAEKKIYNAVVGDVPKYRETYYKADHEEFEDDNASCSSSDLFELENIGVKVYAEELPVYGTTKLKTNKAIANGYAF